MFSTRIHQHNKNLNNKKAGDLLYRNTEERWSNYPYVKGIQQLKFSVCVCRRNYPVAKPCYTLRV